MKYHTTAQHPQEYKINTNLKYRFSGIIPWLRI